MKLCLLLVLLPGLWAQPLTIDCGSATDTGFSSPSTAYTDASMGAGSLSTLRYAPRFKYAIPAPAGLYLVRFYFVEPNATGPGRRVFTVAVNGQMSDTIDIFKAVGPRPAGFKLETTAVSYFGRIIIDFVGIVGNAIVNTIEVQPMNQAVAQSFECIKADSAVGLLASSCNGIMVATFRRPDGSVSSLYALVPWFNTGEPLNLTDRTTWRPAAIP